MQIEQTEHTEHTTIPEPEREPTRLVLSLTDRRAAARAWAAASSTERAMAPGPIADVLIETGGDVIRAAVEGTAAAREQHEEDVRGGWGGPAPRGLDVHIQGGHGTALVWRTGRHTIELSRTGGGRWTLSIEGADLRNSKRVRAALIAAWAHRSRDFYVGPHVLTNTADDDQLAILTAAAAVGIVETDLEAHAS